MDREKQTPEPGAMIPLSPADRQIMGELVAEFMRPIMETIGELLKNNVLESLQAATGKPTPSQKARLEALSQDYRRAF